MIDEITLLVGDRRTREVEHWSKWLKNIPPIREQFCRWSEEFDPFCWNETASVALLGNAAVKAEYLAFTEYVLLKRKLTRGRQFRSGRCDLWIADVESELSWAFEFKQHFAADGIRQKTFNKQLCSAFDDARAIDLNEADKRVGGLILVPKNNSGGSPDRTAFFDSLCSEADIAFRIDGQQGPVWLAFKFVD